MPFSQWHHTKKGNIERLKSLQEEIERVKNRNPRRERNPHRYDDLASRFDELRKDYDKPRRDVSELLVRVETVERTVRHRCSGIAEEIEDTEGRMVMEIINRVKSLRNMHKARL